MATARAAPSSGSVAEPNSSSSTSDCGWLVRDEVDVGDVRGKRRQVLLDRLVVPDIGKDSVEDGQLGAVGGNRNAGLRHQRQQANRLQRYCLAAGVGAADDELAMLAIQSRR